MTTPSDARAALINKVAGATIGHDSLGPTGLVADEEFWVKAVADAMESAWNEICSDTECHPTDIEHQGQELFFHPAHWARLTAKLIFANISAPAPLGRADDGNDILARIEAYDCSDGGHSDAAKGSAYDLLRDAAEEIKFNRMVRAKPSTPSVLAPSPPAQSNWIRSGDGTETIRERRPDDPPAQSGAGEDRELELLRKIEALVCGRHALTQALAEAEKVMEPFAKEGERPDYVGAVDSAIASHQVLRVQIEVGHLRAASAWLERRRAA